ncbi:MAG: WYL domain-containing protein [Alistipes sp.]|nr:WYL domain-containing protein [Alistipes sp.]
MAGNVYQQYVWLLDLINRHDGIQFRKISDAWQISLLNETRSRLPRRTFINHLHKIREIFGVDIECTTGYNYRVVYSNDIDLDNAQQSLLAHLQLSNALFANPNMAWRISLDGYLSFRYFTPLIGAMEQNKVVEIHYFNRECPCSCNIKIEPYYIKQFESGWFVVGRNISKRAICAYAFTDIVAIRESEGGEQFEMLDKEWLREFMRSPQFDDAKPNNNAQYMESLQNHNSRIRRSRWGSYVPENYKVPED